VPLGFDKLGSEVSDLLLVPVGRTRLQGQVDGLLNLDDYCYRLSRCITLNSWQSTILFETISG